MRAFFYRLHNIIYAIILIPLLLFSYLFLEISKGPLESMERGWIFYVTLIGYGTAMGGSYGIFFRRVKGIRTISGLGERLKSFSHIIIVQFSLIGVGCLFLVLGYWKSHDDVFVAFFMISLIALSFWWPSPRRICKQLQLKGAEREMVLHRKDSLS